MWENFTGPSCSVVFVANEPPASCKIMSSDFCKQVIGDRTMLKYSNFFRRFSTKSTQTTTVLNEVFEVDSYTNVTPKILSLTGTNLHTQKCHPLSFIKQKIIQFFNLNFKSRTGNAIFSVYDQLSPIVTTNQNFDSLLVPQNHASRNKNDCYYINKNILLRSHMTAYQRDFLKMGLNNFIVVGDVYRRDEIDRTHYPVFHQLDAVSVFTSNDLFLDEDDGKMKIDIFEQCKSLQIETCDKQDVYTLNASKKTEQKLKQTLEKLTKNLFGENIVYKWSDSYFPFTHPSWELEILLNNKWLEVLGCGVIKHDILKHSGCTNHIGWAFGLGLERLAMTLYEIPDIRIFWSSDPGFTHQFEGKNFEDKIKFVSFSNHPPCVNDISFWLPTNDFSSNDFYELAREIGGDLIEQIKLVDEFKKGDKISHCYRICYRSMDRGLTQDEVNVIHKNIENESISRLGVKVR